MTWSRQLACLRRSSPMATRTHNTSSDHFSAWLLLPGAIMVLSVLSAILMLFQL